MLLQKKPEKGGAEMKFWQSNNVVNVEVKKMS